MEIEATPIETPTRNYKELSEIPIVQESLKWLDEHPRSGCCEVYADDIVAEHSFHTIVEILCKWCEHRHTPVLGSVCESCLGEVIDGKFHFKWDGNAFKSDSDAHCFRQLT